MGIFQNRTLPNMVDIAITDKCNCDCLHCSFKSMKDKRKEMTTEQVKDVIRQSQDIGVTVINFLGGEPLLRNDILEILKSVDKKRSTTLMFTNGWFLEKYARNLKIAGLDSINVSLDHYIPKEHDRIRGREGLFEHAIKGIIAAKKAKLTVAISCCIDKKALNDGVLIKIIELAKKLKVNEVIVFDAIPTGAIADRKDLIGNKEWIEEILNISGKYNNRYDYPSVYPYAHVRSYKSLGCCGGTSFFYITPYGDICPCDFNPVIFGNILETPLYILWDKLNSNEHFSKSSWNGCKLQDIKYRKEFNMSIIKGAKCRKTL